MNWRRAMFGIVAATPVIGLLGYGLTVNPKDIPSPLPGREAPEFVLPVFAAGEGPTAAVIGDSVRLSALRGEVVVLNFWASWCLACRDEHTALSRTARTYADKGVRFYGVLYNDRPQSGTNWIADMGGQSYPSLMDARTRVAIDYGLYGVPETFFIDQAGRVAYKHVGPVTERLLAQKLDSLLLYGSRGP